MSMGMVGEDPIFHVEIFITAAAEQIPQLLERSVGNQAFLSEIERVVNVKGTVKGKLVLGESLDAIDAEVDVDKINASAEYEGFPFPCRLMMGRFITMGRT